MAEVTVRIPCPKCGELFDVTVTVPPEATGDS
jgi:hypothetical protein